MANHAAFIEKVRLISDKNEKMRLTKEYWSGFPAEEFINFLSDNMKEVNYGLEEVISTNLLSKEGAKSLRESLAKGMAEINAMKNKLSIPKSS